MHNATKSIQAKRFSWEGPEYYEPSLLLKKAINGEVNLKRHYLLFDNDYYPHYEVYNILLGGKTRIQDFVQTVHESNWTK